VRVKCVNLREESSESTSSSRDVVVLYERSRVSPIPETDSVADGCSSEINDKTKDEETDISTHPERLIAFAAYSPNNRNNLDGASNDFGFTKVFDRQKVDNDHGDEAD